MDAVPDPVERPKLARWMWDRKLKSRDAAGPLGVTPEAVRKYCLEFGHGDRAMPGRDVLERIVRWTEGAVTERDFYPPHIRGDLDGTQRLDS
jgi:predicted transcriptional regulator